MYIYINTEYWPEYSFKDTVKAFDDFKNKQQKVYEVMFFNT